MKYLSNVTSLRFFPANCTGCGRCVEVCPHAVFEIVAGGARVVDRDRCMECGACAVNCAFDALRVNAGVGCASAIISGAMRGKAPTCGCESDNDNKDACC